MWSRDGSDNAKRTRLGQPTRDGWQSDRMQCGLPRCDATAGCTLPDRSGGLVPLVRRRGVPPEDPVEETWSIRTLGPYEADSWINIRGMAKIAPKLRSRVPNLRKKGPNLT